ncbi:MAG: tetratricopeptide repeat protein [Waddliaceae bacterium]
MDAFDDDESFFSRYTVREYLLSEPAAASHLRQIFHKFPNSKRCIDAHLIFALRAKREAHTLFDPAAREEKLKEAIFDFETAFDFYDERQFLDYENLIAHAKLEHAKSFLEIAQESSPIKKSIYFESGMEFLRRLYTESQLPEAVMHQVLYLLPYHLVNEGKIDEAEKILTAAALKQEGKELAKSCFLLGQIALEKKRPNEALTYYALAQSHGKGELSPSEQLKLWISQSKAEYQIGNVRAAMRLLSQVVNCPTASSLRIEAMFMRAEIYRFQGRVDLAKSQLESIVRIGGKSAKRAAQLIDNID